MRYVAIRPTVSGLRLEQVHEERGQRMFPIVTNENRYLGYITYDDIVAYKKREPEYFPTVTSGHILAQVISQGNDRMLFAYPHESVSEALKTISARDLQFLPVVNAQAMYMGTVDPSSLVTRLRP